jgi:hypothetical protein
MALYENNIRLRGFVGKDAETKSTANVNTFTVFSLATKSSYKDKQSGEWVSHTEWHRIICFGKSAEFAKSLKKGDYAEIEGELRSSSPATARRRRSAAAGKFAPASSANWIAPLAPRLMLPGRATPHERLASARAERHWLSALVLISRRILCGRRGSHVR